MDLFFIEDPMEDQFAKLRKNKKERVAKNELQRLRNIARNMKGKGNFTRLGHTLLDYVTPSEIFQIGEGKKIGMVNVALHPVIFESWVD